MSGDAYHPAQCSAGIDEQDEWLPILRHNHGFLNPESWVSYARSHGFRRVDAKPLLVCPDCGEAESAVLGQYVYYSTMLQLRLCAACGLAYSDARIDPGIIGKHFDTAYKDENYFLEQREPIFRHLARLVDAYAPPGGKVIDIGGAKGHLLAAIQARRPDLSLTLNDIAEKACAHARETYGIRTIRGSVAELANLDERFDVVLMIDVLYYEPEIRTLWQTIDRLARDRCTVVLRIPDRIGLISLQRTLGTVLGRERRETQTAIRYFNPEHIYVLSKSYLQCRLRELGFADIQILPSPLLQIPGVRGLLAPVYYQAASALHRVAGGTTTFTPCFILVARRTPT